MAGQAEILRFAGAQYDEVEVTNPLLAQFTIPLVDKNYSSNLGPLIFRQWLPLRDDEALTTTKENLHLRFWIDKECLPHPDVINLDDISRYADIAVEKLYVEVSGIDVSDQYTDLAINLAAENNWLPEHINSTYDPSLIEEYTAIGEEIYSAVVKQFNRLIAYVRAVKGQYWLQEYKPDPSNIHSEFSKLRAKVKVGESDWVRFKVPGVIQWTADFTADERLIAQEDWESIRTHLEGERKAPLVGQLLATADEFRDLGHPRAALTEAVSSLEIAVSQFAQRANPERWSRLLAGRSSASQLHNHVEHLGLTCTIGYLFPVIFSEQEVPSGILRTCHEAVVERGAVVHAGQRDIDEQKLSAYLNAIRDLCERLRRFQMDSD